MKTIRGRKTLVSGAASGIGRAIALALAREGADLFLLDIDDVRLTETVAEARRLGVDATGMHCDLTQSEAITASVRHLLDRWGELDILVNNAGVAYYGPTEKMTAEQWKRLMDINLHAPIQLTGELLPTLLSRPQAHILNVCSIAGLVAGGRFAAYHVSKFGLVGFSEALRAEYGRRGLGVTALCPGPVRTNLYRSAMSGRKDRPVPNPPAWLCTSEETVARKAVKAIRGNRRMMLVTPMAHLLWNTKRFLPGLLDFANHVGRKRKKQPTQTDVASPSPTQPPSIAKTPTAQPTNIGRNQDDRAA
jgi:short-subunit dehydrogenase